MDTKETILDIGRKARTAARAVARLDTAAKNACLSAMADALEQNAPAIVAANLIDMEKGRAAGLSSAMLDRLMLDDKRIAAMAGAIRTLVALDDPCGRILSEKTRPNGLRIQKVSVPIGVVGIIYESRPNVTSDAATLCIKAGNSCILRGGKEALNSNLAIAKALMEGGKKAGLPENAMQVIPITDREAIKDLVRMDQYLDVIVPRGGHQLIEMILEHSRVPVIKHAHGVCHVYIDRAADLNAAEQIALNAKCQRPGVCNAMETLLVHRDVAADILPRLGAAYAAKNVELRGDEATRKLLPGALAATEEDWRTEYLDYILSIRVVDTLDAAIEHIATYGSGHSDSIVTADSGAAERFLREVDSAAVYVNASTRFTDGGEFGLGAEIGISTDKLHARGPMGLEELNTYKYVIRGEGQIR
ncbi:glutamate-5-semialdehyde dehydrogenase [Oscillatoria amoena NRMC-F 0135]|nr:glutamate-5-semialdehyde dehydrogenase [Oscillatoria laete-virens]MDL5050425.1 glutamate-5-semialdehyde dehydrogenase [Oscillatoria amoena NRMC-F 0135]MDL5054177.1 glutamate-5-semialdehyde dehydrogenase [Oscillatoria laete-virens NRMC-F 0139]